MSDRLLIVSAQEHFDFPLAEAARKQLFAKGRIEHEAGNLVEILIVTPDISSIETVDDIKIRVVTRGQLLGLISYCNSFDRLHYFGTTGLIALLFGMIAFRCERYFTATDGGVFSIGPNVAQRRKLARYVCRLYSKVLVYTKYQQQQLETAANRSLTNIELAQPILDSVPELNSDPVNTTGRSVLPSLLYLGHLSLFKGVDIILELFDRLADEIPGLTLTLASNGLDYGDGCHKLLEITREQHPGQIIIKGRVDPYEELTKAHLLVHPFRQQAGTFAVPLALYEALLCGTPFLASDIEGTNEFFDRAFLCETGNVNSFVDRARALLSGTEMVQATIAGNLERIQKRSVMTAGAVHKFTNQYDS